MKRTFKVGDRVRIRAWEDMEKEFGLKTTGSINVQCSFTRAMRHLCGQTARVSGGISGGKVSLDQWSGGGDHCWAFSVDVLEPARTRITIQSDGEHETIAIIEEGSQQDSPRGLALCDPGDTFSTYEGARIALARLFGVDPFPVDDRFVPSECAPEMQTTPPKYREVARDAAMGEYVKDLRNGKIGEVIALGKNYPNWVYIRTKEHDTLYSGDCADRRIEPPFTYLSSGGYVVLEGYKPEQTKPAVREVKRLAKAGEYIKIIKAWGTAGQYDNGSILRVAHHFANTTGVKVEIDGARRYIASNEYVVLEGYEPAQEDMPATEEETPKFMPRLQTTWGSVVCGNACGELGAKTNYADAIGIPLRVGDTVRLFDRTKELGEYPIVETEDGAFVMSVKAACDSKTGEISGPWQIIKKRGYEEVKHGEIVGHIKYVLEP